MSTHHKRLPKWESFDEITFKVVPRFKTSGLSGDEWRTSVLVEFHFKGEVVYETGFADMQSALLMVGSDWVRQQEPLPEKVIELEDKYCSQPGCSRHAVARYQIKHEYTREGVPRQGPSWSSWRQFCQAHRKRGDQSLEDCDDNYQLIETL